MLKSLTYILSIAFISIFVLFSGCSYDNTLFNAKKYFKAAQGRPLNQTGKPTPQAIDEYNKTIQKCGYILTERKNSKEADDALFLLARALFYRGNSPYQAKDQFQSLLNNFPDSPFAPDATLYLAKVHRQINEPAQAENILSAYLLKPETAKWHPKALLLLADFAIQDKDNDKAQFWLEKILIQYQKSSYAKEASFLLGKNLIDNKDYDNSLKQFTKVVESRGLSRDVKNDARYYMALNLLYLKQPQKSLNIADKLNKSEERLDKTPAIRVLLGRILLGLDKESEGLEFLQNVIKSNSRSLNSAEAYFWMAEYYYYTKSDVQVALDNYSKVKTELAASPFVDEASSKQAALTLIKQNLFVKVEVNPRQFVDHKLEIADYYLNIFNQTDSALATFNLIYAGPTQMQTRLDSLTIVRDSLKLSLDSLSVITDSVRIYTVVSADSTSLFNDENSVSDSLHLTEDETIIVKDSLDIITDKSDLIKPDSLIIAERDSTVSPIETNTGVLKPVLSSEQRFNQIQAEFDNIQKDIVTLDEIKVNYITEYIPYAKFVQAAMLYRKNAEDPLLQTIYSDLETQYPLNKYTLATKLLLEGKTVRLVDTELEREVEMIDFACANIESDPDSSLTVLQELTQSTYKNICSRANFRLGWFYTFEQQDTVKAKLYLDEIAKLDNTNEYFKLISRFYNGKKYIIKFTQEDSLSQVIAIPDSLNKNSTPDSLKLNSPADSVDLKDVAPEDSMNVPVIIEPAMPEENKDDDMQPELIRPEDRLFIKPN